jgi:hypothetical protein
MRSSLTSWAKCGCDGNVTASSFDVEYLDVEKLTGEVS